MIIPSIDVMGGHAVQLVQGKHKKIDAGDPAPIAESFGRVGEIAVIDLDAALGNEPNTEVISGLLEHARCRVGGGIRSLEKAEYWLDRGAQKIILGTAATPEILRDLPRSRVIAALDAMHGEVMIKGWTTKTGLPIEAQLERLAPYVSGFLITFIETEGTIQGLNIERAVELKARLPDHNLTVAGGIKAAEEIGALDRAGIDVQVGMALYSGAMSLGEAVGACLDSDRPDGLWPTVVTDEAGVVLGLVYSNQESLSIALEEGIGAYWSRRRGLWKKGASSGHTQRLLRIDLDCDRDALRFAVQQGGRFCHLPQRSCFGEPWGLRQLERRLNDPATREAPGSYTARLLREPELLAAKLKEEAGELIEAQSRDEVIHEAADLIFFTLMRMVENNVSLADVDRMLDRRALKVHRRPGNAKPEQS